MSMMNEFTRRQFARLRSLHLSGTEARGIVRHARGRERHHLEITERAINISRLAQALDGLRIVQISDLHYGHYAEPFFIRELVAGVNDLAPEIVLLTGDYVSKHTFGGSRACEMILPCARILANLNCRNRWAVLGNHDAVVGPALVIKALESNGFPVLENRHIAYERNGARLWIAGVKSASESHPDLDAAVPYNVRSSGDPVLLLAHEPDFADEVALHGGVDLMLSGHTHGGQIRLPFVGATVLPRLGRKYIQGIFSFPNGLQLYVNRGIGTMRVPVRLRCRPELAVITLRSPAPVPIFSSAPSLSRGPVQIR